MKVPLPCRLSVLTPQGHLVVRVVSRGQQIWKGLSNFYFLSVASDVIICLYNQPVLFTPDSNPDSFTCHFFFKNSFHLSHVIVHMIVYVCVCACAHVHVHTYVCVGSWGGQRLMSAIFLRQLLSSLYIDVRLLTGTQSPCIRLVWQAILF